MPFVLQVVDQRSEGAEFKISAENELHGLCLCLVDDQLALEHSVAKRNGAADPDGCCQTKSPQRLVVVASVHEQPVPLFQ
jgi:hypothetical protein